MHIRWVIHIAVLLTSYIFKSQSNLINLSLINDMFLMLLWNIRLLLDTKKVRPISGWLIGVEINTAEVEPSRTNPLNVFTLFNILFFVSGSIVSELFGFSQGRMLMDSQILIVRQKKRPGSQSSNFWVTDSLLGSCSHLITEPSLNHKNRQWHSRRAPNTAHRSVLSYRNWWDNGVHILYIWVNVWFCPFFKWT